MRYKSYLNDWNDLMKTTVKIEDLNDIYKSIAEEIGLENTVAVYNMFRGTQVSFPSRMLSKEFVYNAIAKEYNGKNVARLAQKYNYTERTIWRIIKSSKPE